MYAGTYEAQKDIVVYRRSWIAWIKCQVKQFYEEHNTQMEKEVPSESERVAANIHLGILKSFFRKQGGSHEVRRLVSLLASSLLTRSSS